MDDCCREQYVKTKPRRRTSLDTDVWLYIHSTIVHLLISPQLLFNLHFRNGDWHFDDVEGLTIDMGKYTFQFEYSLTHHFLQDTHMFPPKPPSLP